MAITIPNVVVNPRHTSSNFLPYNANQATGFIDPTAPPPAQPHHSGCGGIGAIIVAIVAVAVTVIFHVPVLNLVGSLLEASPLSAATAIAVEPALDAGALGALGAVADAAGQGAAIAVGAQQGFNWSEVALRGLARGLGPASARPRQALSLGSRAFNFLTRPLTGRSMARLELRGVRLPLQPSTTPLGSVISQGIGVATGLQKSFSWASVAAAGIEGGVSAAIAPTVAGVFQDKNYNGQGYFYDKSFAAYGANALTGAAALIAGAATRSAITGQGLGKVCKANCPISSAKPSANLIGAEQEQAQQDQQNAATEAAISQGDNTLNLFPGYTPDSATAQLAAYMQAQADPSVGQRPDAAPPPSDQKSFFSASATLPEGATEVQTIYGTSIDLQGLSIFGRGGNATAVATVLNELPSSVLQWGTAGGLQVDAVANQVGQDSRFVSDYVNQQARGYLSGDGNSTYARPGIFDSVANDVILATSPNIGSGTYNLAFHEFGHG